MIEQGELLYLLFWISWVFWAEISAAAYDAVGHLYIVLVRIAPLYSN